MQASNAVSPVYRSDEIVGKFSRAWFHRAITLVMYRTGEFLGKLADNYPRRENHGSTTANNFFEQLGYTSSNARAESDCVQRRPRVNLH